MVVNRRYGWGPQFGGVFEAMKELGRQWMWYPVLDDTTYDPRTFRLDRDFSRIVRANAPYSINIPAEGLARFLRRGKKILVFMGLDDPTLSIEDTVDFQRQVEALAGRAAGNTRMYLMPGVGHCGGFPRTGKLRGAESADMLGILRSWVESGKAPAYPTSFHLGANGRHEFSRPLCVMGTYPRYNGSGDVAKAESFTCVPDATPDPYSNS